MVTVTDHGDYEFMHDRRLLIAAVRLKGFTLTEIADHLGVSRQAVDQFCRQTGLKFERLKPLPRSFTQCLQCNKTIPRGNVVGIYKEGVKANVDSKKAFCSTECRDVWDEADSVNHKWSRRWGVELTCKQCGKVFVRSKYLLSIIATTGRCKNTYCGRECFLASGTIPRKKTNEAAN